MARKKVQSVSILGKPISLGKASVKYGVSQQTLTNWNAKGELDVIQRPERRGQPLLVDEGSVVLAIANHRQGWQFQGGNGGSSVPVALPGHALPDEPEYNTADMVTSFVNSGEVRGLKAVSLKARCCILDGFAQAFPVLPLSAEPILEWVRNANVAQQTKFNRYGTVHAMYNYLRDIKGIESPLKPGMGPRRSRDLNFRVMSRDEVTRLIEFAPNYQDRVMLRTLYSTRVRIGELLSLTRDTVFADHIEVTGKTGKWEVPISQELYQELMELGSGTLFKNFSGSPLTVNAAYHRIERFMRGIGIKGKKLGPHTLRHTSLTHLYEDTGDVKLVQEAAHHTNIQTTMAYTHPKAAKQAAKLLLHDPLKKLQGLSKT